MPPKKSKQRKGDEARRPAPDASDHISVSATETRDTTKSESATTKLCSLLGSSTPDVSSGPSTNLHVGATVRIDGLKAAQYNGHTGTVVGTPTQSSSRVCVRVTIQGASKTLALQQANLTILVTAVDSSSLPLATKRPGAGANGIEASTGNALTASPRSSTLHVSDDAVISTQLNCVCGAS
jgi:ribosomal protein L21E